jgi:hypothetical protein
MDIYAQLALPPATWKEVMGRIAMEKGKGGQK